MPPLIAAVAGALSISFAMAAVVVAMAVITLASVAYSAYMMATLESPKQPDAMKRLQTVRSSVQPHRMIYGECMTGGVLIYAQSHGDNNDYITLVVAFTGHEVEEITEVWLNDKIATDKSFDKWVPYQEAQGYYQNMGATPDGTPTAEYVETKAAVPAHYERYATITKYTGTPDQEADPLLLSLPPLPTTVVSQSPTAGLNDMSAQGDYTAVGMAVYEISITATGDTDTFSWTKTAYPGNGDSVTTGPFGAEISEGWLALSDGVNVRFDSPTGHSIGQQWEVRAFDGAPWTADCRLRGRSCVVVTLENNDKAFPTGLPNVKARIKGNNQIYDPRTGVTGYTDNWALCVRDYLTKRYGLNAPDSDINPEYAILAANICDELVSLSDGTTQKRYTLNGSFTLDKTPTAIMNEMLAAAHGALAWTQGQYRIMPAAYYEPDLTFHGLNPDIEGLTESDLRGQLKVRPMPSMRERFNTVRGTYISPQTWQPVDFPKVTNALYVAQDGGEEIAQDIQLTYITDPRAAQRVAKIVLEKYRQGTTVDFPAMWSAFPLAVGDNVPITIKHLGWDRKIFTVKDWKLNPEGGVDLSLQEDAAGCYEWNNGEETAVDLAPNTILPPPNYSPVPTGLTVGEELYVGNVGSVVKSRAILTWPDMGLTVAQYEVNYLPPGNTIWATVTPTSNTTVTIDDTTPGGYQFRIRSRNHLGTWSDWASFSAVILGKSAPPPPVDSFLVSAQPDGTREFAWTLASPPLDMAGYRVRYCGGSSGVWGSMTDLHSGLLSASPYECNQLAAGEYTFAIVAEDTSGNQSAAKYVTLTLDNPRMAGVFLNVSFGAAGWAGTKTSCYVDETGALVSAGTDTWASFGTLTWAGWTAWNRTPTSPIQYDHPTIDIGTVSRFTPLASVLADGTATVTMSTSSDGSTWSSYGDLVSVSARYVKIRVSVSGASPVIRSVMLYLSAQQITEDVNDLDTSTLTGGYRIGTGDIRLPRTKNYSIIQTVNVTLQGTGAGWTWKLIDKNTAYGPRIQIYNGSGALSDAVIDATIKGL